MKKSKRTFRELGVLTATVCLLATLLSTSPARASQSAADYFYNGMRAMEEREYDRACEFFAASVEKETNTATYYQLGRCNEKQGKFGSARAAYLTAAQLADKSGDVTRAAVARARIAEIEIESSRLLVTVPPQRPHGLTIINNDATVSPGMWNTPIMVDVGEQRIQFVAPGFAPHSTVLDVRRGTIGTVALPALRRYREQALLDMEDDESDDLSEPLIVDAPKFFGGIGLAAAGLTLTTVGALGAADCGAACDALYPGKPGYSALTVAGGLLLTGVGRHRNGRRYRRRRRSDDRKEHRARHRRSDIGDPPRNLLNRGSATSSCPASPLSGFGC